MENSTLRILSCSTFSSFLPAIRYVEARRPDETSCMYGVVHDSSFRVRPEYDHRRASFSAFRSTIAIISSSHILAIFQTLTAHQVPSFFPSPVKHLSHQLDLCAHSAKLSTMDPQERIRQLQSTLRNASQRGFPGGGNPRGFIGGIGGLILAGGAVWAFNNALFNGTQYVRSSGDIL